MQNLSLKAFPAVVLGVAMEGILILTILVFGFQDLDTATPTRL